MLEPFTPTAGTSVVHELTANLDAHSGMTVLRLTQYDQTIPILAVRLFTRSGEWPVPEGAEANVRMHKPDGKHVYDPALGISEDRKTVYSAVTHQMTAAAGRGEASLEITKTTEGVVGVIGSSSFTLDIARNPVPADAYESTDEFKTLQEILDEVQDLEKKASDSAANAAESEKWAREYSGNPPIVKLNDDGYYTWWTWNAEVQDYQDTNKIAIGSVMYATFRVDLNDGHLYMAHDAAYTGPKFQLNGTHLEVVLDA